VEVPRVDQIDRNDSMTRVALESSWRSRGLLLGLTLVLAGSARAPAPAPANQASVKVSPAVEQHVTDCGGQKGGRHSVSTPHLANTQARADPAPVCSERISKLR